MPQSLYILKCLSTIGRVFLKTLLFIVFLLKAVLFNTYESSYGWKGGENCISMQFIDTLLLSVVPCVFLLNKLQCLQCAQCFYVVVTNKHVLSCMGGFLFSI
jgi:hypothetical protein